MAPVQSQSAYSIHNSSFDAFPSSCRCGASFINNWEWWSPISRRGCFFQDSFFEGARAHFDAAVKESLSKWGELEKMSDLWYQNSCSSLTDNLNRYRQLRTFNRLEDDQVTTLISDNNSHKMVMDVHDFVDGEIKMKIVGEKEVVVEGQGHELLFPRSFSRRFCFPETANMAAVTSVLSSDGVLTVEAPMLNTTSNVIETPMTPPKSPEEDGKLDSAKVVDSKEENEKVFYCKGCNKKIGPWETISEQSVTHEEGMKIPIKINATIIKDSNKSSEYSASKLISSKLVDSSHGEEINMKKEANQTEKNKKTSNEDDKKFSEAKSKTSVTSVNESQLPASGNTYSVPISTHFNTFPILKRGQFFSDSIFDDMRKDFQSAVQEVLSTWGEKSSVMDDLTYYRNLRSRDLREENQAISVTQDETNHKIVLDVHDFMNGGDITVKAINDRELVIEGRIEKKEDGSNSRKTFSKRFVLPGDVQLSSVTSVMSSDGILTVNAPKQPQSIQLREFIIPVSIEGANERSQDVNRGNATQETSNENIKNNSCKTLKDSLVSSVNMHSTRSLRSDVGNNTSSVLDSQSSVSMNEIKPSREHIIPVHVEGRSNFSSNDSVNHKKEGKQELHATHVTNSSDHAENSSLKFKGADARTMEEAKNSSTFSNQNKFTLKQTDGSQFALNGNKTVVEEKNDSISRNRCFAPPSSGKYLPIARRGPFFNDSFFEGYQRDFETAVSEVLLKSRMNVTEGEMMDAYRSLRQRNLKVENQALRVHEDQSSFRAVLDVKDFTDGDITVSVEGEELVIEGRTEKSEHHAADALTFSHRFLLPEATNFTTITAAISADGVLTINSPKTENSGADATRRTSSETESKHESHQGNNHYWEKKNVKESSQQSKGFSSRSLCSTYQSQQQHSSVL